MGMLVVNVIAMRVKKQDIFCKDFEAVGLAEMWGWDGVPVKANVV
ncbi:hypothetical protein [Ancylothrix sp. D3o]|nr:hypothetical protein [Ancylothrix sp. D3o]